jgi:hypothetical protein
MKKLNRGNLMPQPALPPNILPAKSDERIQRLTKLTARLVEKILDQQMQQSNQQGASTDEP